MPLSKEEYDQYREWGVTPPTSQAHGAERDIWKNMKRLMPHRWRQEGNLLIGETEMGELVQTIPTNYMLENGKGGLPKLKKLDIKKS